MILVSRNIKYMQIFTGAPWEGRQLSNDSKWSCPASINFNMCTYLFTANMCHLATPIDPFRHSLCGRQERCYVSLNEKMKRHILVPNELKNAELLAVQLGLQ